MKKLTIATLISAALSTAAFAGNGIEKIDTTFVDLDNDDNGYISREEADDDEIYAHFSKIDTNSDMQLSINEFNSHVMQHPQHFDDEVLSTVKSMKESMVANGTIETKVKVDTDVDEIVAATKDKRLTHELRAETELLNNENLKETTVERVAKDTVVHDKTVIADEAVIARSKFEMIDANSDGKLTKAEASRSGVTRDFDKIDANDDELITRTEFKRYERTSEGNLGDNSEE
ncbi:calcium-binding protein [Alteromonas sp. V450]|uniref:EF-hand domain-containing protein n=1 Tax=Alteromonas sp. V450 TaxID=1912139 RepID=UPI0008FF10FC|nr:EF-hand domain-containing protein [Alteromonas sp. V450]OJF68601.1 calcium-binding protein [Alteromonas sp. V450]